MAGADLASLAARISEHPDAEGGQAWRCWESSDGEGSNASFASGISDHGNGEEGRPLRHRADSARLHLGHAAGEIFHKIETALTDLAASLASVDAQRVLEAVHGVQSSVGEFEAEVRRKLDHVHAAHGNQDKAVEPKRTEVATTEPSPEPSPAGVAGKVTEDLSERIAELEARGRTLDEREGKIASAEKAAEIAAAELEARSSALDERERALDDKAASTEAAGVAAAELEARGRALDERERALDDKAASTEGAGVAAAELEARSRALDEREHALDDKAASTEAAAGVAAAELEARGRALDERERALDVKAASTEEAAGVAATKLEARGRALDERERTLDSKAASTEEAAGVAAAELEARSRALDERERALDSMVASTAAGVAFVPHAQGAARSADLEAPLLPRSRPNLCLVPYEAMEIDEGRTVAVALLGPRHGGTVFHCVRSTNVLTLLALLGFLSVGYSMQHPNDQAQFDVKTASTVCGLLAFPALFSAFLLVPTQMLRLCIEQPQLYWYLLQVALWALSMACVVDWDVRCVTVAVAACLLSVEAFDDALHVNAQPFAIGSGVWFTWANVILVMGTAASALFGAVPPEAPLLPKRGWGVFPLVLLVERSFYILVVLIRKLQTHRKDCSALVLIAGPMRLLKK